ncbi:MAG TPA: HAD family phosphatase [Bryobacteraceae bacterium]|jgi:putative hydrolase of the HAD superfamily|nr:HAD family phosphatase [Bryobacteraceae bacterium]
MIKTVIFDLGKVLIPFDFTRGYSAMEQHCDYPAAEIRARLAATDLVERFETGLVEPEPFVRQISSILGLRLDYRSFCNIWSSIFLPDPLVPESLLAGLRRNYRLLLLSNTNAIHFEMIRATYPLLRQFHDFVLSYKVKAMKPSPAIYQAAVAKAGCRAEECFFTDDVAAYVEGARQQGLDAVQFQSLGQLEGELRARGLDW